MYAEVLPDKKRLLTRTNNKTRTSATMLGSENNDTCIDNTMTRSTIEKTVYQERNQEYVMSKTQRQKSQLLIAKQMNKQTPILSHAHRHPTSHEKA